MALTRTRPDSAANRGRWQSIALGTALFLLAIALIAAMHLLAPGPQATEAPEQHGAGAGPTWGAAEALDRSVSPLRHATRP